MRKLLVLLLFSIVCAASSHSAWATKRALVIGVDEYASVRKLKNAVADAKKMADAFQNMGYQTTLIVNEQAARAKLLIAFQRFVKAVSEGDDVVVFYSGHGVEVQGTNYLVPTDVPSGDQLDGPEVLPQLLLSFPELISNLKSKNANATVWIIDACRNNPFEEGNGKALGSRSGLADIENPAGTFIFYSAGAGQTALDRLPTDDPTEKNSVYTREFLKLLQKYPADQVTSLAIRIRPIVKAKADPHLQRPAYYDELDGPWCFTKCSSGTLATSLQTSSKIVVDPSRADISRSLQDAEYTRPVALEVSPNAIFLGKSSSAQNCEKRSPDTHPFGCDALIALATSRDKEKDRAPYIGKPLKAVTEVNIREKPPTVDKSKGAVYGCVVSTLKASDTVTLSGIVDINYAGDTFYWGTISSTPLGCLMEANGPSIQHG